MREVLREIVAESPDELGRPRVLRVRSEPIEEHVDFAVIDQLALAAQGAGVASPPFVDRRAARPDPIVVGEQLLALGEARTAESRLLIIVLDDADWADAVSVQALAFAFRRLHDRRVALFVLRRQPGPHLAALDRIVADGRGVIERLTPLTVAEVAKLARARAGVTLNERAATRLHAHTDGNPLELIALLDELGAADLTSTVGPLPAPRSFATMVLARIARCSTPAEHIIAALAIAGGALDVTRLSQLVGTDVTGPLSEAVEADLVTVDTRVGHRVAELAHPLIRSAILADLPPARRAELHRSAAAVAVDDDRAMIHLLRASLDPDAELAARATARAERLSDEGWSLLAIDMLFAAAPVFPPGPDRRDCLIRAAATLLLVGDLITATDVLQQLPATDEPLRAAEHTVRGEIALRGGDAATARSHLVDAWDASPPPATAVRIAGMLAGLAMNRADAEGARRWARAGLERAGSSGVPAGYAMSMLATSWAMQGDVTEAAAEMDTWRERLGASADRPDSLVARGLVDLWKGELASAEKLLDRARSGNAAMLTRTTAEHALADLWYRLGDWDRAVGLAEQVAVHAGDAGEWVTSGLAHCVAAFVRTARGDTVAARAHIAAARRAHADSGLGALLLWIAVAEGRVATSEGDDEAVVMALEGLAAGVRFVGMAESMQPFGADLVDALVGLGRLDDAERELASLRVASAPCGAHVRVLLARAAAGVAAARGDTTAARREFEAGLREPAGVAGSFARARLELAAGIFERRAGQRRLAASHLDHAVTGFDALGAAPFAARARDERSRCGLRPRRDGNNDLTPAQAAVARLVAAGATNRETADELVISIKTVESHLAQIYLKLGIRSRTELANTWGERGVDPGTP